MKSCLTSMVRSPNLISCCGPQFSCKWGVGILVDVVGTLVDEKVINRYLHQTLIPRRFFEFCSTSP